MSTCLCWCSVFAFEHMMASNGAETHCDGGVGVVVLGEGTLVRQIFMNFVWLVGTYLFAAILGVITGDIMEKVQVPPRSAR